MARPSTTTLCYASAFAYVVFCFAFPWFLPEHPDMDRVGTSIMWLLLTLPVPGTLVGYGAGSRSNHRWRGAIIGLAVALVIQGILTAIVWGMVLLN
jgi:hypothetical protein